MNEIFKEALKPFAPKDSEVQAAPAFNIMDPRGLSERVKELETALTEISRIANDGGNTRLMIAKIYDIAFAALAKKE